MGCSELCIQMDFSIQALITLQCFFPPLHCLQLQALRSQITYISIHCLISVSMIIISVISQTLRCKCGLQMTKIILCSSVMYTVASCCSCLGWFKTIGGWRRTGFQVELTEVLRGAEGDHNHTVPKDVLPAGHLESELCAGDETVLLDHRVDGLHPAVSEVHPVHGDKGGRLIKVTAETQSFNTKAISKNQASTSLTGTGAYCMVHTVSLSLYLY